MQARLDRINVKRRRWLAAQRSREQAELKARQGQQRLLI